MSSVDGNTTGVWQVNTESGSVYRVDLDREVVSRTRGTATSSPLDLDADMHLFDTLHALTGESLVALRADTGWQIRTTKVTSITKVS